MLQRIDVCDRISIAPGIGLRVEGFTADTIVADALRRLAEAAGVRPQWRVTIEKHIPVAAGLGGGSSDAATALRLANATLPEPLPNEDLHEAARAVGSDVPFFLASGPQLGRGDGSELTTLDLPQDYFVVLVLPHAQEKKSTAAVYAAFDRADGFDERRTALMRELARARRPRDLAALPPNDLATSPLADELRRLGAFRADVSGAGPAVYGLFHHRETARSAAAVLRRRGRIWITVPAWYG